MIETNNGSLGPSLYVQLAGRVPAEHADEITIAIAGDVLRQLEAQHGPLPTYRRLLDTVARYVQDPNPTIATEVRDAGAKAREHHDELFTSSTQGARVALELYKLPRLAEPADDHDPVRLLRVHATEAEDLLFSAAGAPGAAETSTRAMVTVVLAHRTWDDRAVAVGLVTGGFAGDLDALEATLDALER